VLMGVSREGVAIVVGDGKVPYRHAGRNVGLQIHVLCCEESLSHQEQAVTLRVLHREQQAPEAAEQYPE